MSSIRKTTLCLATALVSTAATAAYADKDATRHALDALQAAYQPIAQLSGDARATRACADASKVSDAATALIHTSPPPGSVVTAEVWSDEATDVVSALDSVTVACKRADRAYPRGDGKLVPIADVLKDLDTQVLTVLDAAKPRKLPPALKAAKAVVDGKHSDAQMCSLQKKLAGTLAKVATPPAGAAADAWNAQYAKVTTATTELGGFACGAHHGADEEIGESFDGLKQAFYGLILLVPPNAR